MFGAPCSAHGRCVHSSAAAARLPGCGLAARLASAAAPVRGCAHECLAAPGGVRKRARCGLRVQAIADERTDAALLEDALRASSLAEPVEVDTAQAERQKLQQLLNRWGPVAAWAQAAGCSARVSGVPRDICRTAGCSAHGSAAACSCLVARGWQQAVLCISWSSIDFEERSEEHVRLALLFTLQLAMAAGRTRPAGRRLSKAILFQRGWMKTWCGPSRPRRGSRSGCWSSDSKHTGSGSPWQSLTGLTTGELNWQLAVLALVCEQQPCVRCLGALNDQVLQVPAHKLPGRVVLLRA